MWQINRATSVRTCLRSSWADAVLIFCPWFGELLVFTVIDVEVQCYTLLDGKPQDYGGPYLVIRTHHGPKAHVSCYGYTPDVVLIPVLLRNNTFVSTLFPPIAVGSMTRLQTPTSEIY